MASSFWEGSFYFDGKPSSDYRVCIVDFNNSDILKQVGGGYSISVEKDMSYNDRPFYRETEKSSNDVVLQLCRTDGKPWNSVDIIDVNNWLFKENFKKFQPMDFSNQVYNIIYYLKAISMKKYLNSNMEGYLEVTFQVYNGCAYAIPQKPTVLSSNETKTINNMSNINKTYCPKLKIINNGNVEENIIITNKTNGDSISISGMENRETIIIDCAIGSVLNTENKNRFSVLSLTNCNLIRLEKGNNNIELQGNASMEIICEFPIII